MTMKAHHRAGLSDEEFHFRRLAMMGAVTGAPINVATAEVGQPEAIDKPQAGPEPEAPASLDDLEAMVAEARRVAPLNVPGETAVQLAASGATPTQARARLFEMVAGKGDLTSDRLMSAHLLRGRA